MPTYTDPQTGKRIRSESALSDADLEEAFGGGGGDKSTWSERAGSYVEHKAREFVGAAQGAGKDVANLVSGEPYGAGFPGTRGALDTVSDVATTFGPVVAPGLTAAGMGAGTAARALGASENEADLANAATQVVGGVGNAVVQGARGAAGLRGAINRQFGDVAETMAQRGTLLHPGSQEGQQLFYDLARATQRFTGVGRGPARNVMRMLANGTAVTYGDLDNALTGVMQARAPARIAGILRDARDAMTAGTPEAGVLQNATRWAGLNRMRMPMPHGATGALIRGATGLGGLGAAGFEASRGNYGRAAALAVGAGLGTGSVGQALTGARALAGPLARTAVAAGPSVAAGLAASEGGSPTDLPDEAAPEPDTAPAPEQAAPGATAAQDIPQGRYGREIGAVAKLVGVPAPLLQSVMAQESGGDQTALSDGGVAGTPAHGLMQVTPGTFNTVAKQVGELVGRTPHVDNPLDNLIAGGLLWRKYLDMTDGDIQKAGALYYGSPGHPLSEQYGHAIAQRFAKATSGE